MKAEALLALYERVADAPDAIARLRRFVLDLAVRGKLVEQDAADEPALDPKSDTSAQSARVAENIPRNWLFARVGDVLDFQYGKGLPPKDRTDAGPVPVFGSNGIVAYTSLPLTPNPSIIVGRKGSAGALNVCDGPSWTTDVAYFVEAPKCFSLRYLALALESLNLSALGKGVKPGLSRSDAYSQSIWIPPVREQHRIVAKVDELLALLDRIDAARSAREATRDRLTTASLTRLTAADTDPEALRAHARFALDALPALTTRADQIKQLRQTILELAVQGKLVNQDPTDEHASTVLRLIKAERDRLYGLKKIPKPKALPDLAEQPLPFDAPPRWVWCMLGDLCYQVADGPHFSPQYVSSDEGVAFLSTRNVRLGSFDLSNVKYVSQSDHEAFCKRVKPEPNDIIYTKGGTTGIAKVNDLPFEFSVWVHLAVLRIEKANLAPRYVELALNSPHCYRQSQLFTQGTSNFDLGLTRLIKITMPLPPLAEQHRIVAKVDELMALCDRLEAAQQSADSTRARLLEALLHEALTSRADNVIDLAEARARLRPTRSEVGSLIVHHQARRGQGGRIKLGKCLYLAEAHCGLPLGGNFGRANFGPHDEWIYTFEREACHAGWFSVGERPLGDGKLRAEYTPGPALAARAEDARAGLGEQAAELERVLDLLAPLTAEEAEIAATLFAAWNDMLIEGGAVTDEVLITEVREHWHPSKARFTPEVLKQWLGWLRRNGLVPRGRGPSTRQQGRLI